MPSLQFKGKSFVQNYHLAVPFHELIPVKEKSLTDKPSLTDNLIIHGDNLKALKSLLPIYAGKVKCVYIDPPYNTGNEEWRYNDNVNSPMMQEWLGKVVDSEDLTRHDKWLCMMMPRLKLLREIMADNGVIFMSLDDHEMHHFRDLADEIFEEGNWVGTVVWRNVTDNNPTNIAIEHEYVVCYAKNKLALPPEWKSKISETKTLLIEIGERLTKKFKDQEKLSQSYQEWYREHKRYLGQLDRYKYIDKGGVYTGSQSVHNPGREGYRYDVIHPKTKKPCKQPLMGYRFPEATMKELLKNEKILFGDDENKIIELKLYAKEYEDKLPSVITLDGRTGAYDLKEVFPEALKNFNNPKPVDLLRQLLGFVVNKGDIVLDPFAGSGTTAQATLLLNEGDIQFILIESEEYADKTTAERVRRVIKGVKQSKDEALKKGLGGSFTFCELGEPMDEQRLLAGKSLPTYEELARYVFYVSTGEEFKPSEMDKDTGLIGESSRYYVYLYYEPKTDILRNLALDLKKAEAMKPLKGGKRRLVFAPAKYLDQDYLDHFQIDFAQLPYEIYQRAK